MYMRVVLVLTTAIILAPGQAWFFNPWLPQHDLTRPRPPWANPWPANFPPRPPFRPTNNSFGGPFGPPVGGPFGSPFGGSFRPPFGGPFGGPGGNPFGGPFGGPGGNPFGGQAGGGPFGGPFGGGFGGPFSGGRRRRSLEARGYGLYNNTYPYNRPYFGGFWRPGWGGNRNNSFGRPHITHFGKRSLEGRGYGYPGAYASPHYCIPHHPHCNGSHSLSIGCLSPYDRVLLRRPYVKPGKFFWKREKIVRYPADFYPPYRTPNDTITAIKVLDRNCNGTGGFAEVMPGTGVGYRNATIRMYSAGARKGFSFYIEIFGRPAKP